MNAFATPVMHVTSYFDYKSPYAYLAQADTFALASDLGATLELIPYTLDIPAYLGSARTDDDGTVIEQSRNSHQWRRVRYSYMDCRREANRRGLTVRGPRKIFDSRTAHIGFLFITDPEAQRRYHDAVYEQFWRRELDIENAELVAAQIVAAGWDAAGFETYLAGTGPVQLDTLQRQAEDAGVFGVPSYLVGSELFWGAERLERVRERLAGE